MFYIEHIDGWSITDETGKRIEFKSRYLARQYLKSRCSTLESYRLYTTRERK